MQQEKSAEVRSRGHDYEESLLATDKRVSSVVDKIAKQTKLLLRERGWGE